MVSPAMRSSTSGPISVRCFGLVAKPSVFLWCAFLVMMLCGVGGGWGCASKAKPGPAATPPPTFTGPTFLHGTISSLATVRGYEPLYVSGYGLVVGLPGTGSSEVPTSLRRWMINEMSRRGVGRVGTNMDQVNPAAFLDSDTTAVVLVQGMIPRGAVKGTNFDLLIEALPESQTTNLEGGRLWTSELAIGRVNPAAQFRRPMAQGRGPVFLDPINAKNMSESEIVELRRRAVILSGGVVMADRKLQIILRQPSWERSALIAEKINQRFRKSISDSSDTAVAKTDAVIELHIPDRYATQPEKFLALVSYLFLQRGQGFERAKAVQLASVLAVEPSYAEGVGLAWEGLGKTILPVLRKYYDDDLLHLRLAALQAGAMLDDTKVIEPLVMLANSDDAMLRRRAGELLVNLPTSIEVARALYALLDDEDRDVRITAYESLAEMNDPIIRRKIFGQRDVEGGVARNSFKFALDFVQAEKPMIYITQAKLPRVVIFSPSATFAFPLMARLWDSRLMVRGSGTDKPIDVFYQQPGTTEARVHQIAPTLANLILLLGHRETVEEPTPGFDLSYSLLVDVLYQLGLMGAVDGELEFRRNPLIEQIDVVASEADARDAGRPEFSEPVGEENFVDRPGLGEGK